jgi:hypothetical protein
MGGMAAGAGGRGGTAGAGGRGGTAGAGGSGGTGGIPAGCTAIELQQMQYDAANSNTNARLFRAVLATTLGGTAIDGMTVGVISLDPADLSLTGAFALGVGIEANYSTCEHCIVVVQDSGAALAKRFFPVSGTLNIDATTPASNAATTGFQGSLVGVRLIEVTIAGAPTFTSTPVPNGDCLYVVNEPFDAP